MDILLLHVDAVLSLRVRVFCNLGWSEGQPSNCGPTSALHGLFIIINSRFVELTSKDYQSSNCLCNHMLFFSATSAVTSVVILIYDRDLNDSTKDPLVLKNWP